MSVKVLNEKSLQLITVFLIKSLGFEDGPSKPNFFSVWQPEDHYPKLHKLLTNCNDQYHIVTKQLSVWNCKSYAGRYPDQDISVTEEAEWIGTIDAQWFFNYAGIKPFQIHKTLYCYLYQIENDNSEIMKELEKLCTKYGEWILKQTDEWKNAKWE